MSRATSRMLVAAGLLAVAAVLLAACSDSAPPPATPTPTPLSLDDWAEQFCALSAEAADTLDVPAPEDPETLTLEERREWVFEVVAPRVEALDGTAEELAAMHQPLAVVDDAQGFLDIHEMLLPELGRITAALSRVVYAAKYGTEEINTAYDRFVRVQNEVVESLESYYCNNWVVSDETRAALSQPQDCGLLNGIRLLAPTPKSPPRPAPSSSLVRR